MENKRQEELDMLTVLGSLKKGLLNFFKWIMWLLNFSIKKIKILLLVISISVGVYYGMYSLQRTYYSSDLSLSHTRFENDYCKVLVNNLNLSIIGSTDKLQLANDLGISMEAASKIKKISYAPLNEHLAEKYADSLHVLLPFKVQVEVYDNSVLDTLQTKILTYLENNEFAQKRKDIEMQSLIKSEAWIKQELIEIDSLKQLVNQGIVPRGSGNGIILGEPIDPVSVYRRGYDLYERQLVLNEQQSLNNTFEIVAGFVKRAEPSNPGVFFYLWSGIVTGYLIGILWLLRLEFNSKTQNH